MLTAIVIPADPAEPARLEQLDKRDVDAFRALVGGHLQVINLERPAATMYLNDEGKLDGLPFNPRATALLWAHNAAFRDQDVIAGDAFIVGVPDRHGDDTTAPTELVDLLFHTKRYRVLVQGEGDEKFYGHLRPFDSWFEAYGFGVHLVRMFSQLQDVQIVAETEDEQAKLIQEWLRIGKENPAIVAATDPPFTEGSFEECFTVEELEERITAASWGIGTAFYHRDLCFIQQVEGGDEWLTIRHSVAFESITVLPLIERGELASLVRRLLAASKEQCQRLEY
ncbi:DUF3846 domain-containing protein [Streptomyces pluripotens]|uniref:DUF3846 domain-containing protein n=1 Tax=Streptomyces pluripotens TaxID=1355015 RepID=A0A221P1H9_9ACTN|nr:DUF3846 domain-containing protein [Streptomyces pluripotens]ARP71761.1 hypothetical protein LK06_019465 [Streptomyces pluripotens]ASN26014.1 DUF3846 domain-containing protein [Streptomyces pluripotens]